MRRVAFLFFIFLFYPVLSAQSIHGIYKGDLTVSTERESSITVAIEQLFSISVSGDISFLEGFELEIRLSEKIAAFRDTFALFVYNGIAPVPSGAVKGYSGRELGFTVMPPSRRLYIRYAFADTLPESQDPDIEHFSKIIDPDRLPLLCTFLQVMKGIPSYLYSEQITVIARPLTGKSGALSVKVNNDLPLELTLNGKALKPPWERIMLSPGIYHIGINSPHYETITRQAGIERGKITEVSFELVKKVPRISITVPETAVVFLDGNKLAEPWKVREIQEGEHAIVINIGDYSFTKALTVEAGREYSLQLFMDLIVKVD